MNDMLYYCDYIKEDQYDKWKQLVTNNVAGGFHQSPEWSDFRELLGWKSYKIGIFHESTKELAAGAIVYKVIIGELCNFFLIPEGPILNWNDSDDLFWQWLVLKEAILKLTDDKTSHIRIEPKITFKPDFFNQLVKSPFNTMPRQTRIIDLRKSKEDILSDMKQKGRYNIKIAQKNNIKIEALNSDRIREFYKIYKETFGRNKFKGASIKYFKDLFSCLAGMANLYIAKHDGKNLATAITINYGDTSTYMYGGSSNRFRNLMPSYLLQCYLILKAKELGCKKYDLWGVSPINQKKHDWFGLSSFKSKFGGNVIKFVGAYDWILNKTYYKSFIKKYDLI